MVEDGKAVGILDWENAAFFPICYEYVSVALEFTDMDMVPRYGKNCSGRD